MATEAHETGAAFAAGASPELTKTTRAGNERARYLEDAARREHQKDLADARSEWQKRAGSKLDDKKKSSAVDGNLGFNAERDAAGRRIKTGNASLDRRIKNTEDLLGVAQKVSELKDFSEFGAEITRLGLEDMILAQYDRIPQLKPIADLINGRNGATAIPPNERTKLIQHLLDKQPDFALHMMARLKPLLESTAVPDYGLKDLKKQEADFTEKNINLDDELIKHLAQKDARIAGATDRNGFATKDADLKGAQDFIDAQRKADSKLYKDVDKYVDLRNQREYLQKKITATADPVEKAKYQRELVGTDADFSRIAGRAEIRDALGTPGTGTAAENVKNYLISRDTIDLTNGEARRTTGIPAEKAANAAELARLAAEMIPKQKQRDKDEIEYVDKIKSAIAESTFDTLIDRMDRNMATITEDIKKTAHNEMGQKLNQELMKRGFFGERADRQQIRDYFEVLVNQGEEVAVRGLGLPEELRQEIMSNAELKQQFNQAILYNAMKYNGLRRENLDKIMNFEWGAAAIEGAIARNTQLDTWEKTMKRDGLLAGGMVEWLRKHPNKNLVAAILAAILSGVGAAAVVGLASIPAAGLAGGVAAMGGLAGGSMASNLGEAA